MKYNAELVATLAAQIYMAKTEINPSSATDPTLKRQCAVEAVNLIDETQKLLAEVDPAPPPPTAAPKKKAKKKPASFGARR